jgi:hypothetical protein
MLITERVLAKRNRDGTHGVIVTVFCYLRTQPGPPRDLRQFELK